MSPAITLPPDPPIEELPQGRTLYRIHANRFAADAFNPGSSPAVAVARFSFFGDPVVPALYAAETVDAAIGETILRDVPIEGGAVPLETVEDRVLSQIQVDRPLRLLQLHGNGFRQIKARPEDVTLTSPRLYPETVAWGQTAHDAGLDGIVWMSRHHNSSRAYVLFQEDAVSASPNPTVRDFRSPTDLDWLTQQLAPLNVTIRFA